jgi:hypothetical protein
MNEVIAEAAEVCASNAQMEMDQRLPFQGERPWRPCNCRWNEFFSKLTRQHMAAIRIAIFVTQNCRWTARRRAEVKVMRQGGARMRRHVAPARLLC